MEVTNKRYSNILSVARSALDDAVEAKILELNPLYGWKHSRLDAPKMDDDVDPFTPEEKAAILRYATVNGESRPFRLMDGVCARVSKLLSTGKIMTSRAGVIMARKAMTTAAKGTAETTKTAAGKREVKVLLPALEALQAQ